MPVLSVSVPHRFRHWGVRAGFGVENFGFDGSFWAKHAFRLLFNTPRAYQPLVDAWEARHRGTKRALKRLVDAGFVAYQPPVVVDTRTGELASSPSRAVRRWRATSAGKRAFEEFRIDNASFVDVFPKVHVDHVARTIEFLGAFCLEDSHARLGISVPHATELVGMEERLARWWVQRWADDGLITMLDHKLADVREVVPAHWRVTRELCRHLARVAPAYDMGHLRAEYHLARTNFLDDVAPARLGLTGATDFDHDVEAQRIVAAMLRSPRWASDGVFTMEPRFVLPVDASSSPRQFTTEGAQVVFYQPDAELRSTEVVDGRSVVRRVVVEYERFQSRRDAWSHIERLVGWLHTHTLPFEHVVLCFVVDSDVRRRTYVELIEAFVDHLIEHPHLGCANPLVLAVSSVERVLSASDALNLAGWNRIPVPPASGMSFAPVLHDTKQSPYDDYFGRAIS